MKYVITSGAGYFVKPNYKDHLADGIPITTERKEALASDSREEIERVYETLKYNFRNKPLVIEELEIVVS